MNKIMVVFFIVSINGVAVAQKEVPQKRGVVSMDDENVDTPVYEEVIPIQGSAVKDSSSIFTIAEKMPTFSYKDCKTSYNCFISYVADSLRIPKAECAGKVFVQLVIESNGSVSGVKLRQGLANCPDHNNEALRVIETMPKWTPGEQNGKPVRVSLTVPINFPPNKE